jgi:nucleotide-binding universal stress UspA family protein
VGSVAALRRAVSEARRRQADLVSVLAWQPPGGDGATLRLPSPPALVEMWRDEARQRLHTAWDLAMGGTPADLVVGLMIRLGPAGEILLDCADQPGDLLIVGAGRPGPVRRLFGAGAVARYCVAHARCAVLTVPRPVSISPAARRRIVRELTDHVEPRG